MLDYLLPIAAFFYALIQLRKDWEKHQTTLRRGAALILVLVLAVGSAINSRSSKQKSDKQHADDQARISGLQKAVETANQNQKSIQQKLDESIQREQRLNDQNNDLRTSLDAQNDLLQVVKQSLPLPLRKKADAIPKHWTREVYQTVNLDGGVSSDVPK